MIHVQDPSVHTFSTGIRYRPDLAFPIYETGSRSSRAFSDLGKAASIFLTKDRHWSYERERRMLAPLKDADVIKGTTEDPVHLFRLPPDVMQCVIFGARSASALVSEVQQLVERLGSPMAHVRLLQAAVDDERGGLKLTLVGL